MHIKCTYAANPCVIFQSGPTHKSNELMLLVLYFRCISYNRYRSRNRNRYRYRSWYRYRYRSRYRYHHDSFHVRSSTSTTWPPCMPKWPWSMHPMLQSRNQANRSAPIQATRPTVWSPRSNSTMMRATIWASSAGRASYRSRRTRITARVRPSGQNVSQMAGGQARCPNAAATRKCSSTELQLDPQGKWSSRPKPKLPGPRI